MMILLLLFLQEPISVKGSSTLYPVIDAIAQEYTKSTGREIQVAKWGSDFGIQFALSGRGIGMSSRPPTIKETNRGARAWPVGRGRIVLLVNPDNPVSVMTKEQVVAVLAGQITDWSEITLRKKGPIEILGLSPRHGTTDYWDIQFPELNFTPKKTYLTHNSLKLAISKNPNAIGWSSLNLSKNPNQIKILEIDGKNPVDSKEYPFERLLFLVTTSEPSQSFLDFIDFVREPRHKTFLIRTA